MGKQDINNSGSFSAKAICDYISYHTRFENDGNIAMVMMPNFVPSNNYKFYRTYDLYSFDSVETYGKLNYWLVQAPSPKFAATLFWINCILPKQGIDTSYMFTQLQQGKVELKRCSDKEANANICVEITRKAPLASCKRCTMESDRYYYKVVANDKV